METTITESEAKALYGIKNFRNPGKETLIRFANDFVHMDRAVAMKCIEQFPKFADVSMAIINHFYDICEESIKNDGEESIKAYKTTFDSLAKELEREDLTFDQRQYIFDKMYDCGRSIEHVEDKKRVFKENVLKICGTVGLVIVPTLAATIGLKTGVIQKPSLPTSS